MTPGIYTVTLTVTNALGSASTNGIIDSLAWFSSGTSTPISSGGYLATSSTGALDSTTATTITFTDGTGAAGGSIAWGAWGLPLTPTTPPEGYDGYVEYDSGTGSTFSFTPPAAGDYYVVENVTGVGSYYMPIGVTTPTTGHVALMPTVDPESHDGLGAPGPGLPFFMTGGAEPTVETPSIDTGYFTNLTSQAIQSNYTNIANNLSDGNITGDVIQPEIDAVGSGAFWLIIWSVPSLFLLWLTRGALVPCVYCVIMTPIGFQYIPGDWRGGIILAIILSVGGSIYQFFMSTKKY
jgi:hypothetical protein